MAIQTSKPRGSGLSRFSPSPSYASVASKYASSFIAAAAEEKKTNLQAKILAYQNGDISFSDLQNFINDQIGQESGDTAWSNYLKAQLSTLEGADKVRQKNVKRAQLEAEAAKDGQITAQERYKIESEMLKSENPGTEEYNKQQENVINTFDAAQTELVNNKRVQLEKAIINKTGTYTLKDELAVNRELQKTADPNSKTYRDLVDQEVQLAKQVATAGAGTGAKVAREGFDQMYGNFMNQVKYLDDQYQKGQIDGKTYNEKAYDLTKTMATEMKTAGENGASFSPTEYQQIGDAFNIAAKTLQDRYDGNLMDVENKTTGKLDMITKQDLVSDSQSIKPKYVDSLANYTPINTGLGYSLQDKTTGKVLNGADGKAMSFPSQTEAAKYLQKASLPNTYDLRVQTDQGKQLWQFDTKTQKFFQNPTSTPGTGTAMSVDPKTGLSTGQPAKPFMWDTVPTTAAQRQGQLNPNAPKNDYTYSGNVGPVQGPKENGGFNLGKTAMDIGSNLPLIGPAISLWDKILFPEQAQKQAQTTTPASGPLTDLKSSFNAGMSKMKSDVTSFASNPSGFGTVNAQTPTAGPQTQPGGFQMPKIQDFTIPSFNLPSFSIFGKQTPSFSTPEMKPFSFLGGNQGPTTQPSFNLGSVFKPISNAIGGVIGSVRNWLGL